MFSTVSHFHSSLVFSIKAGGYQSGAPTGLNYNGWLPTLPLNIKLGWMRLTLANALAYYDMARTTVVKSFIVQAPEAPRVENPVLSTQDGPRGRKFKLKKITTLLGR